MPYALLTIFQPGHPERELEITEDVVSIGRAADNSISLEDDSNVSRYHAEIEKRDDSFFVLDLGSSNGTTVNDIAVEFERRLRDGDSISIGNSTVIEFRQSDTPLRKAVEPQVEEPLHADVPDVSGLNPASSAVPDIGGVMSSSLPQPGVPAAPTSGGAPVLLIVGGVAGGLILTTMVALLIIAVASRNSCSPSLHIASPQSGATLRGPTTIRLDVEGQSCIDKVIYQIDGNKVATVETSPYDVVLDPAQLKNVGAGSHTLSVSIADEDGKVKLEETLLFSIDPSVVSGPTPTPGDDQSTADPSPPVVTQDTNVDVRSLSDRLAGQISRKSGYVFDRELVDMIRSRSGEYRIGGYTDKARRFRREINKAFRDQGLDPLLGYLLAMSRSKFNENAKGEGVGLWQIPLAVAQAQGYLTAGESEETMKDPKRSAEIAAIYTKALVSTFESTDDFMFAVACFGLPLPEAGKVRTQLATQAPDPNARRDFLKMVKLGIVKGDQVDRVVRFFAAGIVTENPQSFGLQTDAPFSSLN